MTGRAAGSVTPYRAGRRTPAIRALVRPAAVPALIALWSVLDGADSPPPCAADPDRRYPNSPSEALPVIARCAPCPAVVQCEAFALANRERHGVFGARFFGPHRRDDALPPRSARPSHREDVAS